MALLWVLAFDHEGRPVQFDTWLDDMQLYLLSDSKDSVSLFDLASGAATVPPATADSLTRSQWLTRDAAARLAIRNHLPLAECAHFGKHRTSQALYDAVVARYSSPATAALGRLLLPYLFPELSAFTTVKDLVSHLRASDAHYRAAVPAKFLDRNPSPMYITLYFIVTRLLDSLRSVRDHFLSLDPTSLTVDLLEQHLLTDETSAVAVGAARGTPRPPFFEGCSPSPLAPSYASAAAADVSIVEDVGAASASAKHCNSKGKGGRGGGGGSGSGGGGSSGGGGGGGTVGGSGGSGGGGGGSRGSGGSGGGGTGSGETGARRTCGRLHTQHRCFSRLDGAWHAEFGDDVELPRWADLLKSRIAIFDLDFDAILSAMYTLSVSAEGDCYQCLPPDPGIAAAALGASESGTLPGTAPPEALHTFTLDFGASRCFFRDSTTLTPLPAPVPIRLADPSGPVVARSSTVLPCPAVLSGSLSGLHLPSFSTTLVSSRLLLMSPPVTPDSSVAPPSGSPLPASPSWHALSSSCLWPPQVSASPAALACSALPPLRQRASMAATHFLWPFAVRYAANQLNLWPCVSLPETSPTLRWMGEVGDASVFRGLAPSGVSQVDPLPGPAPVQVAVDSGAASGGAERGGAESEGAETGGPEPGGVETEGVETGGAEPRGVATRGAERGGVATGGAEPGGAASEGAEFQLREWFVRRTCLRSGASGAGGAGAAGAGGAGVAARAGVTGGTATTGPGGACTRGTGAAGTGGVEGAGAGVLLESCTTGAGGAGAGGAGVGGPGVGGARARGAGDVDPGGAVRPRPYFVPLLQQVLGTPSSTGLTPPLLCPPPDQTQLPLKPDSPLPSPSPYTEQSGGLTECPPPKSSLPKVPDPESDRARSASPTVSRLLATAVTDPSFDSAAASALVAELLDFAGACRLDYATALVAESASASPPSVGDPDAPDIPTPCSYVEAITVSDRELTTSRPSSSTPKMTTLRVLLHVAAQRDYKLHSLDFSTAFLQGSLDEEIWLRRPPGFTQTTLAALGFAPATADPSLFLRTDTSLPPFYVLVYVDDLVFATADTEALNLVKSELQKRHTCTDLGELCSYLGLQITWDRARRTITLTQSHMVHQVLQRFSFQFSSPQPTPLFTSHSLSAPPSDESVELSGPYPELYVGHGARAWKTGPVVLTGHADASWVDDSAMQRSSQGYTFSLGSGSVSWRSTRLSSVLSSSCEAEIYAGAMAAQELRWLNYMLTDLGEQPSSPPVLYVDNKAMIALCQEHRREYRTKHIALRYFLDRELQQRGQLSLAYVATRANIADVFTKALPPVRLQLRGRFRQDLPVLRLHSNRGGEFCSDLLRDFCRGEGIIQSFTLPASPQQNGVAEHRIGLVMEVARTSMIHAALWPFAVWYVAHQLSLWPCVSLPKTLPTLRWTGEVGDASVFRVRGSRAFVRDTSADKLCSRAIPYVFLGFPPDAPYWQFYHPTSRRVLPSQDGIAPSGVSQVDPLPGTVPVEATVDSSAARGAASGGDELASAEPGGSEPEGAESAGAEPGGAEPGGTEPEGAEPGGAESEGAESRGAGVSSVGDTGAGGSGASSPGGARTRGTRVAGAVGVGDSGAGDPGAGGARVGGTGAGGTGASSPGGAGVTAGARGTRGAGAAGPGGARTRGARAAGPGFARTRGTGAAGADGIGGTGAGDTDAGGAGAEGPGAGDPGAGGAGTGGAGDGGTRDRGTGAGGAGGGDPGAGGAGAGGALAGGTSAGGTAQQ
ncbi:unnamed protein product [Closterium sp. NIES-54]